MCSTTPRKTVTVYILSDLHWTWDPEGKTKCRRLFQGQCRTFSIPYQWNVPVVSGSVYTSWGVGVTKSLSSDLRTLVTSTSYLISYLRGGSDTRGKGGPLHVHSNESRFNGTIRRERLFRPLARDTPEDV